MAEWLQYQPAFHEPVSDSTALSQKILAAHRALDGGVDRLAQEIAFAALIEELGRFSVPDTSLCAQPCSTGIEHAKNYIDACFSADFSLGDLSVIAGLSRFHLIRAFKRATGLTPVAYRNQRRVEAARELLRSEKTIAEIAYQVGFADQSHLTRQFQRLVGTSPARYRGQ